MAENFANTEDFTAEDFKNFMARLELNLNMNGCYTAPRELTDEQADNYARLVLREGKRVGTGSRQAETALRAALARLRGPYTVDTLAPGLLTFRGVN